MTKGWVNDERIWLFGVFSRDMNILELMFWFCPITDDIGNIIDAAKTAAAAANRSTSDTMDQLNDIKAEVTKISITPTLSNMDSVLNNVEMTGKRCTCCFKSVSSSSTSLTYALFSHSVWQSEIWAAPSRPCWIK